MENELRVCIARAALNANRDLRFRIDIVKFIQLLLNELFPATMSRASDTA